MKLRTSLLTAVLLVGVNAPAHADEWTDYYNTRLGSDLSAVNACNRFWSCGQAAVNALDDLDRLEGMRALHDSLKRKSDDD